MVRALLVALAATLAVGAPEARTPNALTAEAAQPSARVNLRGVWKVTELSSRAAGKDWTTGSPSLSVYIFTDRHYSYMFTTGAGPRRLFAGDPNQPTEAEKVGAYDSFVAASGTYVLSGATLTLTATLHKNPNEMVGESLTYAVAIGRDTLQMTIADPPFAPGFERRTVLTRIE